MLLKVVVCGPVAVPGISTASPQACIDCQKTKTNSNNDNNKNDNNNNIIMIIKTSRQAGWLSAIQWQTKLTDRKENSRHGRVGCQRAAMTNFINFQ